MRSRFARVRVRAAHRDHQRDELRPEQWALIEWPQGHKEPMKYWLSTLPQDMPIERMVLEAKMRWRIERSYQDLKQDPGLGAKNSARIEEAALPTHYKPRGSPAHAAPRPVVHHELAAAYRRSLDQDASKMPLLPARKRKAPLVTH